jgi:hypothetical protein
MVNPSYERWREYRILTTTARTLSPGKVTRLQTGPGHDSLTEKQSFISATQVQCCHVIPAHSDVLEWSFPTVEVGLHVSCRLTKEGGGSHEGGKVICLARVPLVGEFKPSPIPPRSSPKNESAHRRSGLHERLVSSMQARIPMFIIPDMNFLLFWMRRGFG